MRELEFLMDQGSLMGRESLMDQEFLVVDRESLGGAQEFLVERLDDSSVASQ
jgi:hypothetical protein